MGVKYLILVLICIYLITNAVIYLIEYLVEILCLFKKISVCLSALFAQELFIFDIISLLDICNMHILLAGNKFFKVSLIFKGYL